jgi:putative membrane protein
MGTADLVPGFSGGTVALVAGIYRGSSRTSEPRRTSSRSCCGCGCGQLPDALRALDWSFLIVLLVGLVGAAFTLASTLDRLLETDRS